MSCQEFTQLVYELADEKPMDRLLRKNALAHALSCPACHQRLTNARTLDEGLQAVAERTALASTSSELDQAVFAAFDRHHFSAAPAAATVVAARPSWWQSLLSSLLPQRSPGFAWALAGVAAILLLIGLAFIYQSQHSSSVPNQEIVKVAPVAPTLTAGNSNTVPNKTEDPLPAVVDQPEPESQPESQVDTRTRRAHKREPVVESASENDAQQNADFIPLVYTEDRKSLDTGYVVRVEVERSALLSLGLPLDTQRSTEKVKADVLLGDNGMALAVRLVQ